MKILSEKLNTDSLISKLNESNNLIEQFIWLNEQAPEKIVFSQGYLADDSKNRLWKDFKNHEVFDKVARIVNYISALGLEPNSNLAIISNTRYEWSVLDYAILASGHKTISIYPSLTAEDIGFIIKDSNSKHVFAENQECLEKVQKALSNTSLDSLIKITTIESEINDPKIEKLDVVINRCEPVDTLKILDNIKSIKRDSVACLVYTSGTTGTPKGVVQTHGNHLANVRQAVESKVFGMDGRLFLYLPLAHSFARLIHHIGFLTPSTLVLPAIINKKSSKIDLQALATDIQESNADYFPSVPRLFEKIKTGLEEKMKDCSFQGKLLKLAITSSQKQYKLKNNLSCQIEQNNTNDCCICNSFQKLINSLIYILTSPIRKKVVTKIFGTNFKHAIIGGAKLNTDLNLFFDSIGIGLYEGYGLTETCVATNVNLPHKRRIGSVGPLFNDTVIKIAEDGEIMFKGPSIAVGYYNNPEETNKSWDKDGWFHTGDIGYLDQDGFLFITDRKKEIIVTAGGKNIPPQKIEQLIKISPLVSQVLLFGDGKPYCIALIWIVGVSDINQDKVNKQEFENKIQLHIDKINSSLPSYEQIKRFVLLDNEPSIDNGMLTPTLKIKRKVVVERFKREIEGVYGKE